MGGGAETMTWSSTRLIGLGSAVVVLLLAVIVALDWSLGGSLRDWVRPERGLTAVSILFGAILLAWQLERQHAGSLRVDAEKARNELSLSIYREIAAANESASSDLLKLQGLFGEITVHLRAASMGAPQLLSGLTERVDGTHIRGLLYDSLGRSIIGLVTVLEKWEIALGGEFHRFKTAIFSHQNGLQIACSEFIAHWWRVRVPAPRREDCESLILKATDVEVLAWPLAADLWDLRVASQNHLLGGLFTWRVPARMPGDPSVVTTVPSDPDRGG